MAEEHSSHKLMIRIDAVDGLFEAAIEEAGAGTPHWVMSAPPRPYEEAVTELVEALERHLRPGGE